MWFCCRRSMPSTPRTCLPQLKDVYPSSAVLCQARACMLAMLSRTPWTHAEFAQVPSKNPALIWARYGTGAKRYRIASLHHAWPFQAYAQAKHTDWLIHGVTALPNRCSSPATSTSRRFPGNSQSSPGDRPQTLFDLSAQLARSSLRPGFLIDHVFSTNAFKPIDVRTGHALGSDHLPIIAPWSRSTIVRVGRRSCCASTVRYKTARSGGSRFGLALP